MGHSVQGGNKILLRLNVFIGDWEYREESLLIPRVTTIIINLQPVIKKPVNKEKAAKMDNLKYLLALSFEQNLVSFLPSHKEY